MIQEHERAVLTVDLPHVGFNAGDVGTVVHIYADGAAYEMEFFALDGRTLDVVTVEAKQVRPVRRSDVLHVRELTAQSVLARHTGFTDAELDFIIHYDIKVRMGRDAETDEAGEEE